MSLPSRIRARHLLKALPEKVEDGEQLLHVTTSSRGVFRGLLAATNRRLIVLNSRADVHEIAYSGIISFAVAQDRRKPLIQIRTESGELVVQALGSGYEDVCRTVHGRMWDASLERFAEPARVHPIRRAAGAA